MGARAPLAWTSLVVCFGCALTSSLPAQERKGDGLAPPEAGRRTRTLVLVAPSGWRSAEPLEGERRAWVLPLPDARETLRVSWFFLGRPPAPTSEAKTEAAPADPVQAFAAQRARRFLDAQDRPLPASAARVTDLKLEGVPGHLIELRGTYADQAPGQEEPTRRPGWTGLFLRLVGPDGVWTARLVGPDDAVARWREAFLRFARSARVGFVPLAPDPREGPAQGEGGARSEPAPGPARGDDGDDEAR